ncbi:MAG TPA: hypothetical protein PLM75_06330, partial [bacterium]|nr:hypothetical protein [bacterium]
TWFFPEIEDRNIVSFMSLIQFDGYNPLEFTQVNYSLAKPERLNGVLNKFNLSKKYFDTISEYLKAGKFTPGDFIMKLEEAGFTNKNKYNEAVNSLLSISEENECGGIHEGYWVDHWLYNLDLIDNYLMIYPDNYKKLFVDNKDYYYFDNPDVVCNMTERFTLIGRDVYQYNSVYRDTNKKKLINQRKQNPMMARTKYGKGKIYRSNLTAKLLCLIANRMASFDPECIGIEMEADKPGWNDSMNGLPGIIGSSLCQTFEMERAVNMLIDVCAKLDGQSVDIYIELFNFIKALDSLITRYLKSKSKNKKYEYWLASHTLKDNYRNITKFGVNGIEKKISFRELNKTARNFLKFITGIYSKENQSKVFDKNGIPYTYLVNKVMKFKYLTDKKGMLLKHKTGNPLVMPESFKQSPLPLFLEGPVHYYKAHPEKAPAVYKAVRNSAMFDKKLKMYKVCESLENAPFEIGRVKAWGAGWIENESVYTHMEYKYILETLKSGLYEQFYKDIQTMLTPYIPTEMYARSPFENVSFIVSSAFPDKKMHGRGLQPRLSGVTGEMIDIWIHLAAGSQPFYVDTDNKLIFKPQPVLKSEFFNTRKSEFLLAEGDKKISIKLPADSLAFKLLGNTIAIYSNPRRKNTFGKNRVVPVKYNFCYKGSSKIINIDGAELREPYSRDLRSGKISVIEIELQ